MGKRIDKVPKKFQIRVGRELKGMSLLIRAQRKALRMTQEQLAEALEISLDTIKAIESGRRFPSLPMLFLICFTLLIEITFEV